MRWLSTSLVVLTIATCAWAQRGGGGGYRATPGVTHGATVDRFGFGSGSPPASGNSFNNHHAEQEQAVEFKSETVLVQVPVVVTDKSGAHIHNLTRDSFQVYENGKEQKVSAFEEITVAHAPIPAPASKPNEFRNLAADQPQQPRTVTIFAIDTINTPFLDQAYGRQQMIKFLSENVEPNRIMGLVLISSHGVRMLSNLTSDPGQLVRVLKKLNGEIPAMQGISLDAQAISQGQNVFSVPAGMMSPIGMNDSDIEGHLRDFALYGDVAIAGLQQNQAIELTMRAFLNIAWSVSGILGRKELVWATGSFPFQMDSPSSVPGGYLSLLYERTLAALNNSEVSVYPVDVRGLVDNMPISDAQYAGGHGPQMLRTAVNRSWLQASTLDTLKDFAAMTGGRAFHSYRVLSRPKIHGVLIADTLSSCSGYRFRLDVALQSLPKLPGAGAFAIRSDRSQIQTEAVLSAFIDEHAVARHSDDKPHLAFLAVGNHAKPAHDHGNPGRIEKRIDGKFLVKLPADVRIHGCVGYKESVASPHLGARLVHFYFELPPPRLRAVEGGTNSCLANGCGVVFRLNQGNVYGASNGCSNMGCGVVFELVREKGDKWTYKILYNFSSGGGLWPYAGLIFDLQGQLYGTTSGGGNFNACTGGCGVVFKLAPDGKGNWTESVLYAFQGADGATPMAALIFDTAGNLYSTTEWGTDKASGTVFKLSPGENGQWSEEVLHSFSFATKDGDEPTAGLVLDGLGNLYGTTQFGGTEGQQGWGTAFKLAPVGGGKWRETILRSFDRDKGVGGGIVSSGLILDARGNLYGSTDSGGEHNNAGTVFKLTPRAKGKWDEIVLHWFGKGNDGAGPLGGLVFDSSGHLLGSAAIGGRTGGACGQGGCGVVFEITP